MFCTKCGTQNNDNNFKCTNCSYVLHQPETPVGRICNYCAMVIPKEAKICPHCRKRLPRAVRIVMVVVVAVLLSIPIIRGAINNIKDTEEKRQALMPLISNCLKEYPNDAVVCWNLAKGRGYKFEEIDNAVKEYLKNQPNESVKKKRGEQNHK